MEKYLILAKHSLPEVVENVPARDWKLSEKGRENAQTLAERLLPYQLEIIVSSREPKAIETAEIVASKFGIQSHVVDGLHEHDRSGVTFLSKGEFQMFGRAFFENPAMLVFGNETADECHLRFERAVYSVLNQYGGKTIVIVAHGTVISLFVSRLMGTHGLPLWSELGLPSFIVLDMKSKSLIAKENI
jgi:broad specificity phosphatase PhoE